MHLLSVDRISYLLLFGSGMWSALACIVDIFAVSAVLERLQIDFFAILEALFSLRLCHKVCLQTFVVRFLICIYKCLFFRSLNCLQAHKPKQLA